jgi:hypothetical protein
MFRLMHVWEIRDGLISRENVWLDGGSVIGQLTGRRPSDNIHPTGRITRAAPPQTGAGDNLSSHETRDGARQSRDNPLGTQRA